MNSMPKKLLVLGLSLVVGSGLGLLLGHTCCAVLLPGGRTSESPTASAPTAGGEHTWPGRVVRLRDNSTGVVNAAVSKEAWNMALNAATAHDREGYERLLLSGQILLPSTGTKVQILERDLGLRRVEILEGPWEGCRAWIAVEDID